MSQLANAAVLGFALKDVADILLVALAIYLVLLFIRQTRSFAVFTVILLLAGVSYLADFLNLGLTRQLFQPLLTFFLVIFVVVFQKEIRRFFDWFNWPGHARWWQRRQDGGLELSEIIAKAARELARRRFGALIVLARDHPLEGVVQGGFSLEGQLSVPLLLSIFDPTSPGHDGAVVVGDGRLKQFGVHLPLAEKFGQHADLGTRHRAALGLAERTDALVLVVSEERGTVSVAERGELRLLSGLELLEEIVSEALRSNPGAGTTPGRYFLVKNFYTKLAALALAVILWFTVVSQAGVINQEIIVPLEFISLARELKIAEVSPREITVTIEGRKNDLLNLDAEALRAQIDLAGVQMGTQTLQIAKSNLSYPSYVEVKEISPSQVQVRVGGLTAAEDQVE